MWTLRDGTNPAPIYLCLLCATLFVLVLSLPGCSESSTSTPFHTPSGVLSQTVSPTAPSVPASAVPPTQAARHDGRYSGTSTVISSGGGRCLGTQKIVGFDVRGNLAQWAGFRGTIDSNGGVQMHQGFEWLVGQFEEARFVGQLDIGRWSSQSRCVYMFVLDRSGP
jgi:hypothetical protein